MVTGCGAVNTKKARSADGSANNGTAPIVDGAPKHDMPGVGTPLATLHLPGKTTFMIVAMPCGVETADCYKLGEAMQEPTRYSHAHRARMELVGTGPQINRPGPAERVLLNMQGRRECVGPYPFTVAYGILRARHDTVTARGGGRTTRFSKATIPARLHPHGVLVYAELEAGANEIIIRAPNGRIVSHENGALAEEGSSSCKR